MQSTTDSINSPQSPLSQASSHFQLEPIPASILADKEAQRRDTVTSLGLCKTGCAVIDEDVLLGGLERGSVVGISAEDEELGVQLGLQTLAHSLCEGTIKNGLLITPKPASVMLARLRDAIRTELEVKGCIKDDIIILRQCLEKVMLSCVFDLDGLWEALADLDRHELIEKEENARQEQETIEQLDEIQDSQDDENEAFSPVRKASPEEPPTKTTPQHPEVIVITHFSSLLTSLFFHREKTAAHAAIQLLNSHLRDLSRNLSSSPLIFLLNSTSSASSGPTHTATTSPAKQNTVDPTLRSIFNPPPLLGYSTRRTKPNFGLIFSQLLDLHLLCTRIPKTRLDAEEAVQQRLGDEIKTVWVVEVLLDEIGVWEGKMGVRPGREQRWTLVDVEKGRIRRAIDEKEPEVKIPNTNDIYIARQFILTLDAPGEALAQCLQESDCVMVERNSAADCLREPLVNTLPLKCRQLKKGFGECKRGMVDMRKRFRGNMPVAYRTMEQAEEGQGYQLYAGRPAFAGGVKKTDGNEPIPRDWREVENEKWKAEQAAMEQQQKK
ncbi:hypothetical protein F53441_722 [Fusarium austroafricanum]|uniref:Uncharacterized protein n=1 Tax=Fusarium austroafricanum TaxID=2364996 RepID=A0A8H4KTQ6_9HYPO|nr:hypothetical protein F53441_722 [Fusarium austroafricanum]